MKIDEMNIVITGANGALASYFLEYFSSQAAFVVGTARRLVDTAVPKNNEAIIEMDPLDHYSIDEAISWINNEAGDIHVWMNCIGGFTMGNYVEEGFDDWIYMYNTNFMTALNCCQQILTPMKRAGWGRIINIGSKTAARGMPLAGPYCASKTAVHSLTQTIALENSNGVTCNALVPGIIDTPTNRKNMPEANHDSWVTLEQLAKHVENILLSKENGLLLEV